MITSGCNHTSAGVCEHCSPAVISGEPCKIHAAHKMVNDAGALVCVGCLTWRDEREWPDKVKALELQIRELEEKLSVISGAARCREFERDRAERLISEMKAEAERKDKMWEDATAKNLEALTELLEALGPFYLHGKALAEDGTPPLYCINRYGSSMLVMGAFNTAIDAYQKWQDLLDDKEQQTEKRK